jgi:pimeloyl-ACP methyl ester carboxylesterase
MTNPIIMLIPPLGHDSRFYQPLKRELGCNYTVCLPDYPALSSFSAISDNLLEQLAIYFIKALDAVAALHPDAPLTAIGGVSLGATISIKMNNLLARKPDSLLLFAPGGLRVPGARKHLIRHILNNDGHAEFFRRSLGIDGQCFEESSFSRQFCRVSDEVLSYWAYCAQSRRLCDNVEAISSQFVSLISAALEVDYELLMQEESSNYRIFWAQQDKVFSMRTYKKLLKVAANAEFHLLDNIGHYMPLEDPAGIAGLIEKCLSLPPAGCKEI